MKKGIVFLVLLIFSGYLFAQHDPEAKALLDAVSLETKSFETIKAGFMYTMTNVEADIEETFEGTAIFKGNKYKLKLNENEVYSDGVTKWVYLADAEEVQISNIADQINEGEENILNDPTKILTIYEEGFKYKYIGEGTFDNVAVEEIDLVPEDLEKPYFKIKVFVNKGKKQLKAIQYLGKDGSRYVINIKLLETNKSFDDSFFMFDKSKYPNAFEVDLRE